MKAMKRLASLVLCVCILIGMPISVQANTGASNAPMAVAQGGLRLTKVELYDSAHVDMTFSEIVALPVGCEIAIGLYKDGALDTTKGGPWSVVDVDYAALDMDFNRAPNNAHKVLLGRIDGTTGKAIKELAGTEYSIGLTITQPLADADTLVNGMTNFDKSKALDATTSQGQDVAFSAVSLKAETLFTLDNVTVINDTQALLTFSEPVTMTAKNSDQTANCYAGWYLLHDGSYGVYNWKDSSYVVLAGKNATATSFPTNTQFAQFTGSVQSDAQCAENQLLFTMSGNMRGSRASLTFTEIDKVVKVAQATGKATRLVFRLGDPYPHADVTVASNNRAESFASANGTPLYAQSKFTQDMAEVTAPYAVSLTDAYLYGSKHMVLTFDQPVNTSLDGVTATLGLYKNGVLDTERGSWAVDLSTAQAFDASNCKLLCSLPIGLQEVPAGYTVGLVVESETTDSDGIVEGITGTDGRPLVANGTAAGSTESDIVYITVKTVNEKLLTLENVEVYNDSELVLTFSEPVNLPTDSYIGLNLLSNPNGGTMYYTYESKAYKVVNTDMSTNSAWTLCQWNLLNPQYYNDAHTQIKVTLKGGTMKGKGALATYSEIVAVSQKMPKDACFVLCIADTNATTQPGGNKRVESLTATDGTPLLATRTHNSLDQKQFVMSPDIRLKGAVIHSDKVVEMQFSSRLQLFTFANNVSIAIGQYDSNGVLDSTKTSWPVTVSSKGTSLNLAYNVFGTVAEMPQAEAGYTLGLMISAKKGSINGVIDGVLGSYSQVLKATHAVAGNDVAIAPVSLSGEATLDVEKVEIVNDNTFILTFTEDIEVPESGTYYAGLTLYNLLHNKIFKYSWNGTAYQVKDDGTNMGQWTLAVSRYGYSDNKLQAKIRGNMAGGTPASYSEILKVVDAATDAELVLRLSDAVNNWDTPGYNGYVDAIGNDKKSLLAADWSRAEDQNDYEYTLIQKGLYVESAVVEDEDTVKVTFPYPVKNVDANGEAILRLVSRQDGDFHWGEINGEYPEWGNRVNFVPANPEIEYNDVWYYHYSDLKALYTAVNDPNNQYYGYILALSLLDSTNDNDGYVQNFVDAQGNWLVTSNTAKDGSYTAIVDFNSVLATKPSAVEMTGEDVMTLIFDDAVRADQVENVSLRFMDENGALVYYDNGRFNVSETGTLLDFPTIATKADEEGKQWNLTMELPKPHSGLDLRTFQALRELAAEKGYTLKVAYAPTAGFKMFYCDITYKYNEDNTLGDFKIEKVKQTSSHELLITFSHDIADLVDMNGKNKPYIALRLVDPSTGALVRYNQGSNDPSTMTPSGTKVARYMQWGSQRVDINGNNRNQLLVTFAESLDVGNLIRQTNMVEELQSYDVVLTFEEADPGNGTFTAGNGLVHHIRRAADGKQLPGTFLTGGVDSVLYFFNEKDLYDPTAEIYVESIKVVGQTSIVATFSEAVQLSGGKGVVALVNTQLNVMTDENGVAYEWGGSLRIYDDARTQVLFSLEHTYNNATYPMEGLDDIVNANLERDDYKLMFGIRDSGNSDGRVSNITTETGKVLLADLFSNNADTVWCLIDQSQIPQGELTMTKIEVISDVAAVATFSAPIEILGKPFMCIRWFDAQGRMLYKTADGEYVVTSKTNDKTNEPMQWTLKWEWYNEEHTQIKLLLAGSRAGVSNFSDFYGFDYNALVEGSYISIGMEELAPEALKGNWHIDNVKLASDPRIALKATKVKGSLYDGIYIDGLSYGFEPREITISSVKIVNDMQLRITFSEPVELIGKVYAAIRFVDKDGKLITWGDEYNRAVMQFGGNIVFENNTQTSMIWTMNGKNTFGANNIYDIVNYQNGLKRLAGTHIQFCIEELTVEDTITVVGKNGFIDNLISKDGLNHVKATMPGGYDGIYKDFDVSILKGAKPLELLSVKAVDDQTLEIEFSEGVLIDETDEHLTMAIRYLSPSGDSEVLTNGKTANFKGNWEYKDDSKKVILWKLKSSNAKSLTQIFNYEGTLKWNMGARICFVLMNGNEELPANTTRMKGITDLSGYRHLSCGMMKIATIKMDVEIAYDKPDPIVESDTKNEEVIEYYSNYLPFIIGVGAALIICAVVAVVIGKKKEGK